VIPPAQSGPLGAGRYDLALFHDGRMRDEATMRVTGKWTGRIRTLVAPARAALDGPDRIRAVATNRSMVAAGDRLVLAVNTTGTDGYGLRPRGWNASLSAAEVRAGFDSGTALAEAGGPRGTKSSFGGSPRSDRVEENQSLVPNRTGDRSANATVRRPGFEVDAPGAFATVVPAGSGDGSGASAPGLEFRRLPASEIGTVYLVAPPTAALTERLEPGRRYDARFVLNESSPLVAGLSTNGTIEVESIGSGMRVVEPQATIASGQSNGTIEAKPRTGVGLNGTTTVAPRTELTLRLRDANESVIARSTTAVETDGSWDAAMDLDDAEAGTEYTLSVAANGERISPLRTVSVVETASAGSAAMGGSQGGIGGSSAGGGDDGAGPGPTASTPTGVTGSPTTEAGPSTTTDGGLQVDPREWVPVGTQDLPEIPTPLRLGPVAVVLIALGLLAVAWTLRGINRLL
jgi:hypothetical protein